MRAFGNDLIKIKDPAFRWFNPTQNFLVCAALQKTTVLNFSVQILIILIKLSHENREPNISQKEKLQINKEKKIFFTN